MAVDFHGLDVFEVQVHREGGLEMVAAIELVSPRNKDRQTARRGRKELHLTAKEFAMLRLMAQMPGEPVSRERFLDVVWGYAAFPTTRTVDNHIASLRSKLERDPEKPCWIKTVHGVGYKLELPEYEQQ